MNFVFIDIAGAVIGLIYIISEYKASKLFWPSSLLMSAFYIAIFFLDGYYANGCICIYNFIISIYGLLVWRGIVQSREKKERQVGSCPMWIWPLVVLAVSALTLFFHWLLAAVGESSYPWIDGVSSSLTIVGMIMLSQKWWQQWFIWMIVEPLMIVLFWKSGNWASVVLYVVFEVFCLLGVISWHRKYMTTSKNSK